MTDRTGTRVIKKYPNRRLYDTEESRYITLSDIYRLVLDRVEFTVVDKQSQTDITRSILLQVISDQEARGAPVLSRDFLSHVIRCYGQGARQPVVSCYLEQSMRLLMDQPHETTDGGGDQLARVNHERWNTAQDKIFHLLNHAGTGD